MTYNKLVRDKIPDLIRAEGEKPIIRTLAHEEYLICLEKKLDEEVWEYHTDKTVEELADILEVVFALAEANGISRDTLMHIYTRKNSQRGGFQDRIFLIGKEG